MYRILNLLDSAYLYLDVNGKNAVLFTDYERRSRPEMTFKIAEFSSSLEAAYTLMCTICTNSFELSEKHEFLESEDGSYFHHIPTLLSHFEIIEYVENT